MNPKSWITMRFRQFVPVWLGLGVLAIAVKWPVYWDHWVFFPSVPNVLDSIWMTLTGAYLLLIAHDRLCPRSLRQDRDGMSPAMATILMVVITILLAAILYIIVSRSLGL